MSPNDIEVLIHCFGSREPHPRLTAPAVRDALDRFMVEVRARELVMSAFQDALQKDASLILKHAKKFIEDAKGNITKAKADGQRALEELRKMRDKIKTKGPINGFHLVVDKNLQSIEQRLASMDLDIEMCDAALKELESYSSDEKHVVEYKAIQWGMATSTGGWW